MSVPKDVPLEIEQPTIGHNQPPDWAQMTVDRLSEEYADTSRQISAMLEDARQSVPAEVTNEDQLKIVTTTVVTMRDQRNKVIAFHKREKEPYLRQGQGADTFFFAMRDRLDKAMDVIGRRGNEYNLRKEAEERQRRIREAEEAAAKARAEQAERDRLQRETEEAERAAARARKPENIERLEQVAEKTGILHAVKEVDAMIAAQEADDARIAAAAPAADLVRTRFDTGHMATGKQVPFVEIVDAGELDLEKLRPYLKEDELLRALKAWAKVTGYKQKMAGAVVELRTGTVYR